MSVAVVTISPSLSAPDFGAADALMLRLMSTYGCLLLPIGVAALGVPGVRALGQPQSCQKPSNRFASILV